MNTHTHIKKKKKKIEINLDNMMAYCLWSRRL